MDVGARAPPTGKGRPRRGEGGGGSGKLSAGAFDLDLDFGQLTLTLAWARCLGAVGVAYGCNAKKADPYGDRPSSEEMCGGVLLSREASLAVPSALRGLTSGFGMGPGVSPSLWPPQLYGIASLRDGSRPYSGNRIVDANRYMQCL